MARSGRARDPTEWSRAQQVKLVVRRICCDPASVAKDGHRSFKILDIVYHLIYITRMAKDAIINARVESRLKAKVDHIFDVLGLSPTEAITLFYKQVELNKGLPFEVKMPNRLTQKTLKDSQAGKNIKKFKSQSELYADLGI